MNPFLYPALMVLCACGIATRQILSTYRRVADPNGFALFLFAIPVTASVWTIAACMLALIGLGATTGTGARGAIVTTVVSTVLVAYVIYRWRKNVRKDRETRRPARRSDN